MCLYQISFYAFTVQLTMLFLEPACTGETSENCELHVSAVCLSLEKARKSFT